MLKLKKMVFISLTATIAMCLFGCGKEEAVTPTATPAEAVSEATTQEVAAEAMEVVEAVEQGVINTIGNTANNISNDGRACIQGDYIYYIGKDKKDIGLYRMKTDGTSFAMLRRGEVTDINVIGDDIYFIEEGSIIKVNSLGQNETIVKEDRGASELCVTSDWIYYVTNAANGINNKSESELNKIYKVKNSGVGDILVTDKRDNTTDVQEFCIVDNTIYYMDTEGICSMQLDGSNVTRLLNEQCDSMNVTSNGIYFVINGKIYKIANTGGESVAINEDMNVSKINVTDNAIYYINEAGLGKLNLDGSGNTLINADWGTELNVAGDWIFSQKGIYCYKVKTDGTEYLNIGK